MKALLLLFFMGTLFIHAQTTHDLDWSTSSGTNLDLTIDAGDTVRWTWADALPHSVQSTAGVESFDSGISSGNGTVTFEYTFSNVGVTDYRCGVHTGSMQGTITVNSTASIEDSQFVEFNYSPNPVQNKFLINAEINMLEIEIYSVLGQRMLFKKLNDSDVLLDISELKQNIYYGKILFDNNSYSTFTIIKE